MALRWQQGIDARQLLAKALIEQPIGFVKHQGPYISQLQCGVVHQVEQAPGRGDHDVGAPAQTHHLWVDGYASKHHADFGRRAQVSG